MLSIRKILFRLLTPVVILVLLWSQSSFVVLQIARCVHYQEVRKTEGNTLSKYRDTISISHEEAKTLVWIKDDEIKYRGRMFDVKRQLHRGDKVLLVGHYDSKDDKLFSAISSAFGQEDKGHDKNKHVVPHVLAIEAIVANFDWVIKPPFPDEAEPPGMQPSQYYFTMNNPSFHPPDMYC